MSEIVKRHLEVVDRANAVSLDWSNGVVTRFRHPVLEAEHAPLFWRYDLDPETNPWLMERMGVNSCFNSGAMLMDGRYLLMARVEGSDRKSFFAVAESDRPTEGFRFWDYPVDLPETGVPDVNVYDMRLVSHEDGYIYGLFCTERRDPEAPDGDTSSAVAACGIARTKDLRSWERLEDLRSDSPQQRNVVLHPEFVDGQYALYTRPQDGFIDAGKGGGIGWALCPDITKAAIHGEEIVDGKEYHTIKESKNGQGPAPIRTGSGWLHIAHGVRANAAGLRYVLYAFMTDLERPWVRTHSPGGYLMAPVGEERVGDVSNVLFCNGAVSRDDGTIYIYYGSSDTRLHVAETSVGRMVDYCVNTPPDPLTTGGCVAQRNALISRNLGFMERNRGIFDVSLFR